MHFVYWNMQTMEYNERNGKYLNNFLFSCEHQSPLPSSADSKYSLEIYSLFRCNFIVNQKERLTIQSTSFWARSGFHNLVRYQRNQNFCLTFCTFFGAIEYESLLKEQQSQPREQDLTAQRSFGPKSFRINISVLCTPTLDYIWRGFSNLRFRFPL